MSGLSHWHPFVKLLVVYAALTSAVRTESNEEGPENLAKLQPLPHHDVHGEQHQDLSHAHGTTGLQARKSSRGPFYLSCSCLPPFADGRRVCGSRNPILMNEHDETPEEKATRVEAFKVDLGHSYAYTNAEENLRFMRDNGIQAFITLEGGHVSECEVEMKLLKKLDKDLTDADLRMKARSCGDNAVGYQNQGNNSVLLELSPTLGEGERWGLVPIPDAAAVRLPYMHLWKHYADNFFGTLCKAPGLDAKWSKDCRILTHCVGGNGRTGMMIMTYVLDQIRQQKVPELTKMPAPKEWLDLTVDLAGHTVHEMFGEVRNIYYADHFDELKFYLDNECTQAFCTDSLAETLLEKALLPEEDRKKDKLLARCRLACSICADQGLSWPYEPIADSNPPEVYTLGNQMPAAALQAMVLVIMVRGLKAGEFYHVTPRSKPPGQCMRLVQWWHCLADPKFRLYYAIPGWRPLLIDCHDKAPFQPNEFGVYQDWVKSTDPGNEKAWGPEENPGGWQPTSHEKAYLRRWDIQPGGAPRAACPDDAVATLECHLGEPMVKSEEPGYVRRGEASAKAVSLMPN